MNYSIDVLDSVEAYKEAKQYWIQKLSSKTKCTVYPITNQREAVSGAKSSIHFTLENDVQVRLREISKGQNLLLYTYLLTVYKIVLYKTTYDNEITVATPLLQQGEAQEDSSHLLISDDISGEETFKETLRRVNQTIHEALNNQFYPLDHIASLLSLQEDCLKTTVFAYESVNSIAAIEQLQQAQDTKLLLSIRQHEGIQGTVFFDNTSYSPEMVNDFLKRFQLVLRQTIEYPDLQIKQISLMTDKEINSILVDFNDTDSVYPSHKTIHHLFEEQVERTPDQIAVKQGEANLSYKELNEKVNQFARLLLSHQVKQGDRIGIMADHSIDTVIAIIAILKAGASYVPIDPRYPQERVRFMIEDSAVRLLVTDRMDTTVNESLQLIDLTDEKIFQGDSSNVNIVCEPDAEAYMLYTSGSTGQPKGVMVHHRGVVNYLYWAAKTYVKGEETVFPLYSSISFDLTVTSLFVPLITGNTMIIYQAKEQETLLLKVIEDDQSDVLKLTPAHLRLLLNIPDTPTRIRRLIVGGEMLSSELAFQISEKFGHHIEIYNEYGPTETTVGCMTHLYNRSESQASSVGIGVPADNTQIYLLDPYMMPCPNGVVGELYIGGDGVAVGYWGNKELTDQRFVENPFRRGGRLYRTGDLARRESNGILYYLGRTDDQIKIRGYRIEIAEVESALLSYEAVSEAAVIARGDGAEKNLCAYLVLNDMTEVTAQEIQQYLYYQLPDYMVPSQFMILTEMPMTSNGKIDRRALQTEQIDQVKRHVPARTPLEQTLVEMWNEIFAVDNIGVTDSFFALGGHSIKAITLLARIEQRFQVQIPVGQMFRVPTIEHLAQLITEAAKSKWSSIQPAEIQASYPVTSTQQRLYIMNRFEGAGTAYNMPTVLVLKGMLDVEKVRQVVAQLVDRHESFRTSFEWVDNELRQVVHEHVELEVGYEVIEPNELPSRIERFIKPFDLSQAPLLRVDLIQIGHEEHVLMLDMHHIISDGVSLTIFQEEFSQLYRGEQIPSIRLHYKDIAVWQKAYRDSDEFAAHASYWLERYQGELPVLELPTDYKRPIIQSFEGDKVDFSISPLLTKQLNQMSSTADTTIFMVLLSAYYVLLSKYSGQKDLIVGTTITGRTHVDMENIIGAFINVLPLRNQLYPEQTFHDLLMNVREHAMLAYEHQQYPFELLVEEINVKPDLSRNPLFDTMFVFHNHRPEEKAGYPLMDGIEVLPNPYWTYDVSKYDLTMVASYENEQIILTLEYCKDLFEKDTAIQMSEHFLNIVEQIIQDPMLQIADIQLLSPEERLKIEKLQYQDSYQLEGSTITELFERQVRLTPNKVAVECDGIAITYLELNEHANRLAHYLRQSGVNSEDCVGILLDRSVFLMAAIFGVLKAGAAYVPLDPSYPIERLEYMISDSKMKLLLVDGNRQLGSISDIATIDIHDPAIKAAPADKVTDCTNAGLAYMIYTSGSTGAPKGVMIEHRSLINLFVGISDRIDFDVNKTILALTTVSFDIFVIETLLPLTRGMRVVLATDRQALIPDEIADLIQQKQIDMLQFTPTRLKMLLDYSTDLSFMHDVTDILIGGEALTKNIYHSLIRWTDAAIYHVYGPTETSVWSTVDEVSPLLPISLGKPIGNTQLYVLDSHMHTQPFGVIGELHISGEGLARGYWNKPDLTNEKFIVDPYRSRQRMYKTGDLVKQLRDGTVLYMGRKDDQVKVGGYRIELGEIENYLLEHDELLGAVVTVVTNAEDVKALCAYLISSTDVNSLDLRQYCLIGLPHYMIPSYFVQLDEFPLTPNGKIDKKRLPKPQAKIELASQYVAPQTETEMKLAKLWSDVLKVRKIGIKDNFFESGGTSIQAVMLEIALDKEQLPNQEMLVYKYSTIEDMAQFIDKSLLESSGQEGGLILS